MSFSQLKHLQRLLRVAFCLSACLMAAAGCALHKKPQAPPPTFPPVPESSLQELRQLPPGPYDRVQIITVEAEVGERLVSALKSARQSAAQKGANAIVLLKDTEFTQKVGSRRLSVRRITYLAIRR
jgi:membrane-bound ClpP family serine protease